MPSTNSSRWKAALIPGAIALAVYAASLAPTIAYGGDCGDLIASSYTLGNSHPTGYPLYHIVGKIASHVPLGEVAARYNALSALCAAIAVSLLALVVFELTESLYVGAESLPRSDTNRGKDSANGVRHDDGLVGVLRTAPTAAISASIVAGLSLTFFYVFWSQAVIAEVYTPAAALQALMLLLGVMANGRSDRRWFLAYFLVGGLAFAHHVSTVFVFLPVTVYVAYIRARSVSKGNRPVSARLRFALGYSQTVALCLILFLAPLLLYSYIPVRSAANEGQEFWGDLTSLSAVWRHVSGALYRSHMFALSADQILHRAVSLALILLLSFFGGSLLLVVGVGVLLRDRPALCLMFLAIIGCNGAIDLAYDVGDWINFFFPTYLVCALFIGIGAHAFVQAASRLKSPVPTAVHAMILFVPVLQGLQVWLSPPAARARVIRGGNDRARRDAHAVLSRAKSGSRIFVRSDELLFSIWYLQRVVGEFTDREVVSTSKYTGEDLANTNLLRALIESAEQTTTYTTFWLRELKPWHLLPHGSICLLAREPPFATMISAPQSDLELDTSRNVKRPLLLPLKVRWKSDPGRRFLELAFVLRGSTIDPPSANIEEVTPMKQGALEVTPQVIGWKLMRELHPGAEGEAWEEQLACEVPAGAFPGRYRVYARWKDKSGRKWRLMGETHVTDL